MAGGTENNDAVHLLDTCVLLAYIRAGSLGKYVEDAYSLMDRPYRPLICEVTVGELLSLARRLRWGDKKVGVMETLLRELIRVDISSHDVMEAYAELDCFCVSNGHGVGKNDLWIAAATRVTDAVLLTTDRDFDPLIDAGLINGIWIDPNAAGPAKS